VLKCQVLPQEGPWNICHDIEPIRHILASYKNETYNPIVNHERADKYQSRKAKESDARDYSRRLVHVEHHFKLLEEPDNETCSHERDDYTQCIKNCEKSEISDNQEY